MITKSAAKAIDAIRQGREFVIFNGDCANLLKVFPDEMLDLVVTSPPYFIGKEYETSTDVNGFTAMHEDIGASLVGKIRSGGHVAWQVGNHVDRGAVTPLDFLVYNAFSCLPELTLRNRIVWTFGHGVHAKTRFSGRHETIMWYSKGDEYYFNLDKVRVPQKYPGKRHYKGPKKGEWSGNPLGKNPGDIWEIPNVKANHIEKTNHPCQFPVALIERLVLALSPEAGIIFDPFCGSGSAGIAAVKNGRRFLGCEIQDRYCKIAEQRFADHVNGVLQTRPLHQDVHLPEKNSAVATAPPHFTKVQNEQETI